MVLEHNYPPDIRVEKEIRSLLNAGHQILLACATRTGSGGEEEVDSLTIIRKRMSTFIYKSSVGCLKFPFYFNFWRKFLKKILLTHTVDALHIHDLPLAKLAWEIKKNKGIPFVLDCHENYPYMLESSAHTQTFLGRLLSSTKQWLKYEKMMLRYADVVFTVIDEQKDRFLKMGLDEQKVFIVSNTPELLEIETDNRKDADFVFVYAGNVYGSKGMEVMIKGFKVAADNIPQAKLWIVGDIKKWNDRYQVINKEDESLIKCWGWQTLDNLYRLIAQADAALLPHLKNRNSDFVIPNKLFQYMMAGKPVIASNCNPIQRILKETEAGLIYRFDDYQDLADKMTKLYQDRHNIRAMGEKGKKAVFKKYNWSAAEKELLTAYNKLLA